MVQYSLVWRAAEEWRRIGDAAMSQDLDSSGLYNVIIVDDRNERPFTIAFATIVTMWLLVFGFVSLAGIDAQPHHMAESAASIVK
jgi:hypothetical protein